MSIRVVMLGDIVGTPGRQGVAQQIPVLRSRFGADLIVANAENAASGSGLTPEQHGKLIAAGLDGITLGDHIYKRVQIVPTLEREMNIIRPANLPAGAKGRRWMRLTVSGRRQASDGTRMAASDSSTANQQSIYFMLVLGRVHATLPCDEPFAAISSVLAELPEKNPLVIVEVHGEATSEKQAIARWLDGRVAAVVGTHTHVPTADARILPKGTAFISDLGMCGPYESIIGRKIESVVHYMSTSMPLPFDVAEGDVRVCGAVMEIDEKLRLATRIERIELSADVNAPPFVAARG